MTRRRNMKVTLRFPYSQSEPYHQLACAIIKCAVIDWNSKRYGVQELKSEIKVFFRSDWFETLCEGLGVGAEDIRRELGIPSRIDPPKPRITKRKGYRGH